MSPIKMDGAIYWMQGGSGDEPDHLSLGAEALVSNSHERERVADHLFEVAGGEIFFREPGLLVVKRYRSWLHMAIATESRDAIGRQMNVVVCCTEHDFIQSRDLLIQGLRVFSTRVGIKTREDAISGSMERLQESISQSHQSGTRRRVLVGVAFVSAVSLATWFIVKENL